MEATIIKNDEFKTIGLVVKHANVEIFSWGITCPDFYFSKTINADKYTGIIMQMIKEQQMMKYYDREFVCDWFSVFQSDENVKKLGMKKGHEGEGVNFGGYDSVVERMKDRIEMMVNEIK